MATKPRMSKAERRKQQQAKRASETGVPNPSGSVTEPTTAPHEAVAQPKVRSTEPSESNDYKTSCSVSSKKPVTDVLVASETMQASKRDNFKQRPKNKTGVSATKSSEIPAITEKAIFEMQETSKADLKAERKAKKLAERAAKAITKPTASDADVKRSNQKLSGGKGQIGVEGSMVSSVVASSSTAKKSTAPSVRKLSNDPKLMAVDDRALQKKSVRKLQRRIVQRRPQEPCRVNFFNHLTQPDRRIDAILELGLGHQSQIHPVFLSLGVDIDEGRIRGSNPTCFHFLRACVTVITSYRPPTDSLDVSVEQGDVPLRFSHDLCAMLVRHVNFLNQCRPLLVTISNAMEFIKQTLTELDSATPDECREKLLKEISSFAKDTIRPANRHVAQLAASCVRPGECVCTFGYSTVVAESLEYAWRRDAASDVKDQSGMKVGKPQRPFSVLIVDSRPNFDGRRMLMRLKAVGIPCEMTHIAALPTLASKVRCTLLGACGLLSNGHVLGRIGTAQVANIVTAIAHTPVLVCAETYKFRDWAQSNSFEWNELSDPDDLWRGPRGSCLDWRIGVPGCEPCGLPDDDLDADDVSDRFQIQSSCSSTEKKSGSTICSSKPSLSAWRDVATLRLLHLTYDVLPPQLVTAVVTDLGILPTTSVPVVLRVRQSETAVTA